MAEQSEDNASQEKQSEHKKEDVIQIHDCSFHARSIAVVREIAQDDKLAAIRCGDEVTFLLNGVKCRGEVHGWKLTISGREHRAIVGDTRREHDVELRAIVSRHRDKGMDSGTVTF